MSESQHQQALFRWAALESKTHPELAAMYCIANGGARSKATAGRLKAEGVKPGVPDICLPVNRGGCNALYIELKSPKERAKPKGRVSLAQHEFMSLLERLGNATYIAFGWEDARIRIIDYLTMEGAWEFDKHATAMGQTPAFRANQAAHAMLASVGVMESTTQLSSGHVGSSLTPASLLARV